MTKIYYHSIIAEYVNEKNKMPFYLIAFSNKHSEERVNELKKSPNVRVHAVYKGTLEYVVKSAEKACKKN